MTFQMPETVRRQIRLYRAWRDRYRPPLELGPVARHVRSSTAARKARDAWKHLPDAVFLARFFRSATAARSFFVPLPSLHKVIADLPDRSPQYAQRTLLYAEQCMQSGLSVYDRWNEPLGQTYCWEGIDPAAQRDPLYRLRPHRFGFLPQLALAVSLKPGLSASMEAIVASWMEYAQSSRGQLAYATKLVVTQRLLATSWAWAILASRIEKPLAADEGWKLEALLLRVLYADIRFLVRDVGTEFPNNHRLADWFAAWYAAFLFPELLSRSHSPERYEQGWLAEFSRQNYADGTSFEQSAHYHEMATELTVAYVLLKRANGTSAPDWIEERLHRMLRFQADLHGNQVEPAAFGDTTEDPMFPLDTGGSWSIGGNRELLRSLFEPDLAPAPGEDPSVERAFWLLGGSLKPTRSPVASSDKLRGYPEGGFFILRDRAEELVFRTGPAPGAQLCAGHAHADLLSVHLRYENKPLIVEAGTHTYLLERPGESPPWRRYFVGPAAHNGLTIEGEDPLEPVTGQYRSLELETRVALTRCSQENGILWVEGRIDCSNRYDGHRRGLIAVEGHYWVVYDVYPDAALEGTAWSAMQLRQGTDVAVPEPGLVRARAGEVTLWVAGSGTEVEVHNGNLTPLAGWVSGSYGVVQAAPQLRFPCRQRWAVWALRGGVGNEPLLRVAELHGDDHVLAMRIETKESTDLLVIGLTEGPRGRVVEDWDLQFDGDLLWLPVPRAGQVPPRMLSGSRLRAPRHGLDLKRAPGTHGWVPALPHRHH